jgi:hypothetical protein
MCFLIQGKNEDTLVYTERYSVLAHPATIKTYSSTSHIKY